MSKKTLLASICCKSGLIWLVKKFNRKFSKKLLILGYHRIYDMDEDERKFSSDADLVSASVSEFDWQIRYLKENYNVITFSEYIRLRQQDQLKEDYVIITFDDGFSDNYENAYPVLKKHGIPAVFYITVNYIGTSNRFWFELLVSVIKQIPQVHLGKICSFLEVKVLDNRLELADCALLKMKSYADSKRVNVLNKIREYCLNNQLIVLEGNSYPMDWASVVEMSNNGMEIGSHTLTHPILTCTDNEQCEKEIVESKAIIEEKLGAQCVSISYPNGGVGDISESIVETVKNSGYVFGCSYISGSNKQQNLDTYKLKRLHVERYVDRHYFSAFLAMPFLFSY